MLNTAALVDLAHRFLPDMLSRGDGIIVNVASMAAFMPCAYSAV
ncbi:SDR family NAD(P)-dependent oxidoreductase [Paenibacillus pinistramenti]|nr:SDR family NAD(P)-dependent oxidoreductase [Paenibacillus pinistramenti]